MLAGVEQKAVRGNEEGDGEPELTPEQEAQVGRVRRILKRSCGQFTFPREYWDLMQQPGIAVHAPRQTGKTEALLHMLDACRDRAILVAPSRELAHNLRARYWTEFKVKDSHAFANASSVEDFMRGNDKPVFCDEWFMFDPEIREFLARSGRVEAAIGTALGLDRPNHPTIQCIPLL